MAPGAVPDGVWAALDLRPAEIAAVDREVFRAGTGAASGEISLLTARLGDGRTRSLVRKTVAPLPGGRHGEASRASDHWAHWQRELLAYRSGWLPHGPGLRAPRLLSVEEDTLYLEYVDGELTDLVRAAYELGRWHRRAELPDEPWLARHQLAQRIRVSDLDWSRVDVGERLPAIWRRRDAYLEALDRIPSGVVHGDFSTDNLRDDGSDVVLLDWATLGVSPVGTDVAHLALAALDDRFLGPYLDGLGGRYPPDEVELGYRATVALVGTSRAHWMATRNIALPVGHAEFVVRHAWPHL